MSSSGLGITGITDDAVTSAITGGANTKAALKTLYPGWLDSTVNVKDPRFGAKGDGSADDTAAIQAAIDYVAGRSTNGQFYGGTIQFPNGVYRTGKLTWRSGVYAMTGRVGPGYREAPARLLPINLVDGDALINPPTGQQVRQGGLIGFSSYGGGSTTQTTFLNFPDAADFMLDSMHIDNYGAEAVILSGSNCRVFRSYIRGLLNTAVAASAAKGAFTLSGADHQISHNEFTGASQTAVSSASLFSHAALISCAESEFDANVFQLGDIGMGLLNASRNRFVGCRFDTNAGHGLKIYSSTYNKFTGCTWSRNSYSLVNTYDHISVDSTGGSLAMFEAPMFTNNGKNVRYNISDAKSSGTFYNLYINAFGDSGQTGFYNVTGSSVVQIPDNPPVDVSGATPSVLNRKIVAANNASAVTITDFTDAAPGQRLVIFARDAGNTTIQHNNTTIVTKSGANIVLGTAGSAEFIKRTTTQWREI